MIHTVDVGNLISGSSAFPKSSLNKWKFLLHELLKPSLENFEHYFSSVRCMQLCHNLNILWHWLSLGLQWKLTFSSPVATAEFSKCTGILSAALSHHLLGFEIAQPLRPTWLHIPGCLAWGEWSHKWLFGSLKPFLHSFSLYSCHRRTVFILYLSIFNYLYFFQKY